MKFTDMSSGINDKEWYGNIEIRIENEKEEVVYAQKLMTLESDVTLVPLSYMKLMTKHQKEIFDFISEKYPEQVMSEDYVESLKFLDIIK